MEKHVVVIGGGISGIITSLELKKRGVDVCLIEAKDRLGKKILASGNGKCNILNRNLNASFYNTDFVKYAIEKYNFDVLYNYYLNLGIMLREDEEGRVYPYSESSNTILNALLDQLSLYKVDVFLNEEVKSIKKENEGFIVKTTKNQIKTDKIVLSTGSNASFGINSHYLLGDLGQKTTKLKQTLVPLKTKAIIGANGVRAKVKLSLYIENELIFSEDGEVLFKEGAISGILAFKASIYLSRWMVKNNKDEVNAFAMLDFVPNMNVDELRDYLNNSKLSNPLVGVVHKAIAQNIKGKDIAFELKNYKCKIDGLTNLENAQVMSGGLDVNFFDDKTYMSKTLNNVYACGEVLDVDGQCGGYNLSFALASSLCVVDSICKSK